MWTGCTWTSEGDTGTGRIADSGQGFRPHHMLLLGSERLGSSGV